MAGYWPSSFFFFFFFVFMDRDEVEVHKNARKEGGQYALSFIRVYFIRISRLKFAKF